MNIYFWLSNLSFRKMLFLRSGHFPKGKSLFVVFVTSFLDIPKSLKTYTALNYFFL